MRLHRDTRRAQGPANPRPPLCGAFSCGAGRSRVHGSQGSSRRTFPKEAAPWGLHQGLSLPARRHSLQSPITREAGSLSFLSFPSSGRPGLGRERNHQAVH